MLAGKINFNSTGIQNYGISFGNNDKGLDEADKNFKVFIDTGKQLVQDIKNEIERHSEEYRSGLENDPVYIQRKNEDIERTTEILQNHYNSPIYDSRTHLRDSKCRRLVDSTLEKALDPDKNDYAAQLVAHIFDSAYKIDNLKNLSQELDYLKGDKKSYLNVSRGYSGTGHVYKDKNLSLSAKREVEEKIEKNLINNIKYLADQGDLAAKLILWTRDDNSGLTHYNFKDAQDHLIDQLDMKVKHWGHKIKLNGEDIGIDKSNLESLKPRIEKHLQTIREGFSELDDLKTSELICNKLTDDVKVKALEYAEGILKEMEEFENSPQMLEAKESYEKRLKEHNEKLATANPRQEAIDQFEIQVASSLKDSMTEKQKGIYRKEEIPRQLEYWTRVGECSPKKILLLNPKPRDFMPIMTTRGFGGSASIDKDSGDITLEFPEGNTGYFKNIEFKGKDDKNKEIEHFKITEAKPDGSEETYDLYTACKTPEGDYCIKIVCSSGNETVIKYGEAKPIEMVVRKPVIAFRGFSQETGLTIVVNFSGNYKVIYPKEVNRDGQTISWTGKVVSGNQFEIEDKKYPYLFWDGLLSDADFDFSQSYCVSGEDAIEFLENKCSQYGLDNSITTDFITFWAPFLQENKYNLVKFLSEEECNKVATLTVKSDSPVNITRFYMVFKAVNEIQNLPEPQLILPVTNSNMPIIIDWGGFQV